MHSLRRFGWIWSLLAWSTIGFAEPATLPSTAAAPAAEKKDILQSVKAFVGKAADKTIAMNLIRGIKDLTTTEGQINDLAKAYLAYTDLKSSAKVWNYDALFSMGLSFAAMGSFATGINIPGLALVGGVYTIYKLDPVNRRINHFIFGKYLYGPQTTYNSDEFNPRMLNVPYVICTYYDSVSDQMKDLKPKARFFVHKDDYPGLAPEDLYRGYLVGHGRWVKVVGTKFDIVRFASIDDPVKQTHICMTALVKRGIIKEPVSAGEMVKIIPQVGYSSLTDVYPQYYYVGINLDEGGKVDLKYVLLGQETQEKKEKKKKQLRAAIKSAPVDQEGQILLGEFRDNLAITHEPGEIYPAIDILMDQYGEYEDRQNAFEHGKAHTADQVMGQGDKLHHGLESGVNMLQQLGAAGMVVGAITSAYYLFKAVSLTTGLPSTVDELIYGKYLVGPNNSYPISEFEGTKLNRSFLRCNYMGSPDDIVNGHNPVYKTWAKAKAMAIPKPELIDGEYVKIHGRWMEMARKSISFATADDDPMLLLTTCQRTLEMEKDKLAAGADFKELNENIVMTTGNTFATASFPFMFYYKQINPDTKKADRVTLFRADEPDE